VDSISFCSDDLIFQLHGVSLAHDECDIRWWLIRDEDTRRGRPFTFPSGLRPLRPHLSATDKYDQQSGDGYRSTQHRASTLSLLM
jgi:hypothetical protein